MGIFNNMMDISRRWRLNKNILAAGGQLSRQLRAVADPTGGKRAAAPTFLNPFICSAELLLISSCVRKMIKIITTRYYIF